MCKFTPHYFNYVGYSSHVTYFQDRIIQCLSNYFNEILNCSKIDCTLKYKAPKYGPYMMGFL